MLKKGARIGDHFIRGCADDRCDIQIGVGSYIESKCCYTELCNNESFFFPNSAHSMLNFKASYCMIFSFILMLFIRRFHWFLLLLYFILYWMCKLFFLLLDTSTNTSTVFFVLSNAWIKYRIYVLFHSI